MRSPAAHINFTHTRARAHRDHQGALQPSSEKIIGISKKKKKKKKEKEKKGTGKTSERVSTGGRQRHNCAT